MSTSDSVSVEVVRSKLSLSQLVTVIYFIVCGGAFGLEALVGNSGPGVAMILILVTPLIWGIPTMLMVTELSTAMPVVGGYYSWVKKGLGPFWGFQQGWFSWVFSFVYTSIFPVMFADYLNQLLLKVSGGKWNFLDGENNFMAWLVAVAVIWFFAWLNIKGAKSVGDSTVLFAVLVIAPFLTMSVLGFVKWLSNPIPFWQPTYPPEGTLMAAFGTGLFVVMWNYLGWDGISTVINDVKDPKKNLPKAMVIVLPIIMLSYFLPVSSGLAGGSDWTKWDAGYFPSVAEAVGGQWLAIWVSIGGLFSAAGLYTAIFMSNSRVPFVLANDGYLPKAITKLHPVYGTPYVSIIVCAAIFTYFSKNEFTELVVASVVLYGVALMLQFATFIRLRLVAPNMKRPFKVPGGTVGAVLISFLPLSILVLASYNTYQEEGPAFLTNTLIALITGPIAYFICKAVFKKDQPDVEVPIDFEEGASQHV